MNKSNRSRYPQANKRLRSLFANKENARIMAKSKPAALEKKRTAPCDDQAHCQANKKRPHCPESPRNECPGFPFLLPSTPGMPNTPMTYNNRSHDAGPAPWVCNECMRHGQAEKLANFEKRATAAQHSGPRAQLCKGCTRDEMKLYYERCMGPNPWDNDPSGLGPRYTQWVNHWPTSLAAHGHNTQDLCLCNRKYVRMFMREHCHACRDTIFQTRVTEPHHRHEHFLRERTKAVIKGEKLCSGPDGNGGTKPHRVRPAIINARMAKGIGRMCPCGEKPVDQDFIDICLACMGVRVIPDRIPTKYQQNNVLHGRITRSSQRNNRTKGPARAERGFQFRVNIERGYLASTAGGDPELNPVLRH
ncbi:hypothetical protein HBI56_101260 [Parastagonospora nodorum]|nr:hypothetical protein HBH53_178880 [Parastagonospora nodorum]KAH3959288.1 hypothetical protein HBH51_201230 [Parastagonospora nodorum]KAH3984832.1 hypothetical protein HBH52_050650 [Parastagonospora nodorum]KAH4006345.1 hypothetical protein HBI10_022810 [Parastagonospora nodorum]KAH4011962.1 hypothetical protein HBI13_193170 [Parastagonospora nodorum]